MLPILLTVIQSDFGFNWNFTLVDAQNVPVNLTGLSLLFKTQLLSDSAVQSSAAMVIDSAAAGTCHYTVQQNDFIVAGQYDAQVKVMSGIVEVFGYNCINIMVKPSLPQ